MPQETSIFPALYYIIFILYHIFVMYSKGISCYLKEIFFIWGYSCLSWRSIFIYFLTCLGHWEGYTTKKLYKLYWLTDHNIYFMSYSVKRKLFPFNNTNNSIAVHLKKVVHSTVHFVMCHFFFRFFVYEYWNVFELFDVYKKRQ